jgi:hypothetical protein
MIEEKIKNKMDEIQKEINTLYHLRFLNERQVEKIARLWDEYEKLEKILLQIY